MINTFFISVKENKQSGMIRQVRCGANPWENVAEGNGENDRGRITVMENELSA